MTVPSDDGTLPRRKHDREHLQEATVALLIVMLLIAAGALGMVLYGGLL
jgi:hypothetical protein